MDNTDIPILIDGLNGSLDLTLPITASFADLEAMLAQVLDKRIRTDFHGLVQLLYKIDVNESKLRTLLNTNKEEDAGLIIARLIIERQLQKIETRRKYTTPDNNSERNEGGEERW